MTHELKHENAFDVLRYERQVAQLKQNSHSCQQRFKSLHREKSFQTKELERLRREVQFFSLECDRLEKEKKQRRREEIKHDDLEEKKEEEIDEERICDCVACQVIPLNEFNKMANSMKAHRI